MFYNLFVTMYHNIPTTVCTRGGLWDRTIRDGLGSRPSTLPIPPHPPPPFQLQAPHPQVKWSNFFSVSCQPTNPNQLKLNLEWTKKKHSPSLPIHRPPSSSEPTGKLVHVFFFFNQSNPIKINLRLAKKSVHHSPISPHHFPSSSRNPP